MIIEENVSIPLTPCLSNVLNERSMICRSLFVLVLNLKTDSSFRY